MRVLLSLLIIVAFGCSSEAPKVAPKENDPAPVAEGGPAPTEAKYESLTGLGGGVSLGASLNAVKAAFPAPEGAKVYDESMAFTIFGGEGWTWSLGDEVAFEAAFKDGKAIALATTNLDRVPESSVISREIERVGKPTRMKDGKHAAMLVWDSGMNARIFLVFKTKDVLFGAGTVTVIGDRDQLRMLGYNYDHPETFVSQIDGSMEQLEQTRKKDK